MSAADIPTGPPTGAPDGDGASSTANVTNVTNVANADERRRRILDAALAEFAERGFHRASTNSIAEAAGVAKGLVFHHFKNKDALFLAVSDEVIASLQRHFDDAMASAPADLFGRIKHWSSIKMRLMRQDPRLWRFLVGALEEAPRPLADDVRQRSERLIRANLPRFGEGLETSKLRRGVRVDDIMETIWTLGQGLERGFFLALQAAKDSDADGDDNADGLFARFVDKADRLFAIVRAGAYVDHGDDGDGDAVHDAVRQKEDPPPR